MSGHKMNTIRIVHFGLPEETTSAEEMAKLAGGSFPLRERVPEAAGEAFDLAAWLAAWRSGRSLADEPQPTHLKVEAADSFEAVIPWGQLAGAAVLYVAGGESLKRGGPARLYVPNGTSACLNVKSVVVFRLLHEPEAGSEASYGFRGSFAPEELLRPYRAGRP